MGRRFNSSPFGEAPQTYKARLKLIKILEELDYHIEEEVELEDVKMNMGEEIYPPYRADMVVTKSFIIELDPETNEKYKSKGHGTRKKRIHDQWRDTNIRDQIHLKTVRLKPDDILNYDESLTLREIEHQLRDQDFDK